MGSGRHLFEANYAQHGARNATLSIQSMTRGEIIHFQDIGALTLKFETPRRSSREPWLRGEARAVAKSWVRVATFFKQTTLSTALLTPRFHDTPLPEVKQFTFNTLEL